MYQTQFILRSRKILITNTQDNLKALITSANPHDESCFHDNVAVIVEGLIVLDLIETEEAILKFSNQKIKSFNLDLTKFSQNKNRQASDIQAQVLTEGKIKNSILNNLKNLQSEDEINLAMFYLSDRQIIKEIIKASQRGVEVKIILDQNKDAFGYQKNGIPNRVVVNELFNKSNQKIQIKWAHTKGEQFHTKLLILKKSNHIITYLGSANFTKRNLDNKNLETHLRIISPNNTNFNQNVNKYFNDLFNNKTYQATVKFKNHQDKSIFKYWLYRFQEFSGISTF